MRGRLWSTDFISGLYHGFTDRNGLRLACGNYTFERDKSAFVRESVTESVGDLGEAGVKSAHIIPLWDGVTVRVSVAEENFEGTGRHKDKLGRMKDEIQDRSIT